MLFSAAALPTILLFISKPWLAAANERDRRRTCNPPLAGLEVSIISTSSGSSQWGVSQDVTGTALSHALGQVPLNSSAEWSVMQIGASQPTYIFRDINKDTLAVDAPSVAGGQLKLSPLDSLSQSQRWQIDCQQCFPDVAYNLSPGGGQLAAGCSIMQVSSDYCAELMSGVPAPIGAASCSGSSLQTFDFWLPTFNTGMGRPDSPSSHWQPSHSSSSSTPLPSSPSSGGRRTCNPTLTGLEVRIVSTSSGVSQWGVSQDVTGTALSHSLSQSTAEWRVMQIGSSPDQPTYVFGDIKKDSLVVDAQSVAGAALKLSPMDSSSQSQRWQIDCQQCYPDVAANPGAPGAGQLAEGCTVMQVSSDYCAEVMSGTSAPIGVTSCSGSSLQTFDFWPAFKTGMEGPDSPSSHWQPSHSSSSSTPSPSSPSSSGGTCAPDVGGLGVSIIAGSREWGVSSAVSGTALRSDLGKLPLDKTAEWRVKQLGSVQGPCPPKYIFEEIGHTDLVVNALGTGGGMPVLTLSPFDTSSETQIWHVECHECESNKVLIEGGGLMGRRCTINLLGSGLCAQIESGTTASIGLASCSKAAAQTFDFYHTIPAASVPSGPQPSSPGAGSSPSCSSGPSCASSCPHVASGNLLSGALSSDNSAGFNYAPVIIGILSTNLLILLVLLCLGVMNFIRNGKKTGLTRNYVPVKMKDTDAFLAPPFEDGKRYSDS